MPPKPKPEENPVPINFRVSPKEKEAWQLHAQNMGIPLATFIKKKINEIVFEKPIDYAGLIEALQKFNTDIIAVAVVLEEGTIAYATENWGPTDDLGELAENWIQELIVKKSSMTLQGIKYSLVRSDNEHLVSVDRKKDNFLLGAKNKQTIVFAKVPGESWTVGNDLEKIDADPRNVLHDLDRVVAKMNPTEVYVPPSTTFGTTALEREEKVKLKEKRLHMKAEELTRQQDLIKVNRENRIEKELEHQVSQLEIPLKSEEQDIITNLEKNILGKNIRRIRPPKNVSNFSNYAEDGSGFLDINERFPAQKNPCSMITKNGHVVVLTLRELKIDEFPESISNLKHLSYLNMSHNKFSDISPSIGKLEDLEYLFLKNNGLTKIPDFFRNLKRLVHLNLESNSIIQIPNFFSSYGDLKYVNLTRNPIIYSSLSKKIKNLVDRGILIIDEIQIPESVKKIIDNSKK
ncbi:MAG: leucine-rich repeat domain-containing protein [Promethearchaeota archaeon]